MTVEFLLVEFGALIKGEIAKPKHSLFQEISTLPKKKKNICKKKAKFN